MSALILIDRLSKQEVGRRAMQPVERYDCYRHCADQEPWLFQGKFYVLHSVAWRIPEEDCVACVTYHSNEIVYSDDD